jgi:hypothetical protein
VAWNDRGRIRPEPKTKTDYWFSKYNRVTGHVTSGSHVGTFCTTAIVRRKKRGGKSGHAQNIFPWRHFGQGSFRSRNVVSSIPAQARCARYNIMWSSILEEKKPDILSGNSSTFVYQYPKQNCSHDRTGVHRENCCILFIIQWTGELYNWKHTCLFV